MAGQLPGGGDAVGARHPDVHQYHVRTVAACGDYGGRAVPGLRDPLDVLFGLQDGPETGPDHRLVVGHHHADRHSGSRGASGRRAATCHPPTSVGPATRSPPQWRTLSRIPTSPWPPPVGVRPSLGPLWTVSATTAAW